MIHNSYFYVCSNSFYMFFRFTGSCLAAGLLTLAGCSSGTDKTGSAGTDSLRSATTLAASAGSAGMARPDSGRAMPMGADSTADSLLVKGRDIQTGPVLPGHRIVAYYGNPHSKRMGALGEYEYRDMLRRLDAEAKNWAAADTAKLPVQTALHLVAISAQGAPGKDGGYRLRMSDKTIRKVINWGADHKSIVFLDIQVGKAKLGPELAFLEPYLRLPYVHLGIDPEFSMKTGAKPGTRIGTFDARDINEAVAFLSRVTRENNLPPKVLVVHRFTQGMVTNYKAIRLDPNVQIVMNMDGWGPPVLKKDSYKAYIQKEPVQYTGFKLFYKNDLKNRGRDQGRLMLPADVLALTPRPIYIQYQ
jgi:hypothetical protein